ncbi:hypothetical protein HDV00_007915 [Rhizophlyctis rosea]|nr:hypothetical protein HDV00_007915 [Rhizophlyctis rosea]
MQTPATPIVHFLSLPEDVIILILNRCSLSSLGRLEQSCRALSALSHQNDAAIWKAQAYKLKARHARESELTVGETYRNICQSHYAWNHPSHDTFNNWRFGGVCEESWIKGGGGTYSAVKQGLEGGVAYPASNVDVAICPMGVLHRRRDGGHPFSFLPSDESATHPNLDALNALTALHNSNITIGPSTRSNLIPVVTPSEVRFLDHLTFKTRYTIIRNNPFHGAQLDPNPESFLCGQTFVIRESLREGHYCLGAYKIDSSAFKQHLASWYKPLNKYDQQIKQWAAHEDFIAFAHQRMKSVISIWSIKHQTVVDKLLLPGIVEGMLFTRTQLFILLSRAKFRSPSLSMHVMLLCHPHPGHSFEYHLDLTPLCTHPSPTSPTAGYPLQYRRLRLCSALHCTPGGKVYFAMQWKDVHEPKGVVEMLAEECGSLDEVGTLERRRAFNETKGYATVHKAGLVVLDPVAGSVKGRSRVMGVGYIAEEQVEGGDSLWWWTEGGVGDALTCGWARLGHVEI